MQSSEKSSQSDSKALLTNGKSFQKDIFKYDNLMTRPFGTHRRLFSSAREGAREFYRPYCTNLCSGDRLEVPSYSYIPGAIHNNVETNLDVENGSGSGFEAEADALLAALRRFITALMQPRLPESGNRPNLNVQIENQADSSVTISKSKGKCHCLVNDQ